METAFAPMVVTLDIKGLETNLLRSGTEWVDDLPLLVLEMHDWMSPGSGSGVNACADVCRFPGPAPLCRVP